MTFAIDLDGRRALVTGAGQGVGLSISRALSRAGAEVLVNDIQSELVDKTVADLRAEGGKAEASSFDVTDWQQVSKAVAGGGDIDVLVNNAGNAGVEGFAKLVDFVDTDPSDWQRFFAVNLFGVMHCTKAVLPSMIAAQSGRIVTIISDAARTGEAKLAPYAAAKAGAAGFCRSIAAKWAVTRSRSTASALATSRRQPQRRLRPRRPRNTNGSEPFCDPT